MTANKGQFQRGHKKIGGRQQGGSKAQVELKEAILKAFESAGGATYLKTVAKDHPQVFCSLLGRVLPMTVSGQMTLGISEELQELMREHDGKSRSIPKQANGAVRGSGMALGQSLLDRG